MIMNLSFENVEVTGLKSVCVLTLVWVGPAGGRCMVLSAADSFEAVITGDQSKIIFFSLLDFLV